MKPSIFLQTITLLFFAGCITAFLAYRTGKFDSYLNDETASLQTSSNGGAIQLSQTDSSKTAEQGSVKKLMMSSSKVIIMTDAFR